MKLDQETLIYLIVLSPWSMFYLIPAVEIKKNKDDLSQINLDYLFNNIWYKTLPDLHTK